MKITILGLSITSSWGNGHATTYRGLVKALALRGHDVVFLERDMPWYAENRDLPHPPHGRTELYSSVQDLQKRFARRIGDSDVVIVGSYVPQGVQVGDWAIRVAQGVTAFYDIDTPVTLAKLERNDTEYIAPELIPKYNLYLSFTGGPMLDRLQKQYGSPMARALYCSVDPELYYPEPAEQQWDLGYLGTYSDDRQPVLDRLMLEPARHWADGRMVVAGPLYPADLIWPPNVERIEHLSPGGHRAFYNSQRFTLNVTRADMVRAGFSPSVRLFEAGACGTPIISDYWDGLDTIFEPGKDILVSRNYEQSLRFLTELPEPERAAIGASARSRVLSSHTSAHRAVELEQHVLAVQGRRQALKT